MLLTQSSLEQKSFQKSLEWRERETARSSSDRKCVVTKWRPACDRNHGVGTGGRMQSLARMNLGHEPEVLGDYSGPRPWRQQYNVPYTGVAAEILTGFQFLFNWPLSTDCSRLGWVPKSLQRTGWQKKNHCSFNFRMQQMWSEVNISIAYSLYSSCLIDIFTKTVGKIVMHSFKHNLILELCVYFREEMLHGAQLLDKHANTELCER